MNLAGIIFSDEYNVIHNGLLNERTLAAVPYGARYRLIDFPLSCMVNAGVINVGIIVKKNYHSLMRHIGSGAPWDLDRKNGGVQILPPFATRDNNDTVYQNMLEGLIANRTFIRDLTQDYILITSVGKVGMVNYAKMFEAHIKSGARISLFCSDDPIISGASYKRPYIDCDGSGVVRAIRYADERPEGMSYWLNTFIISRKDLIDIINEATEEKKTSMRRDFFDPMIRRGEMYAFKCEETVSIISTVEDYLVSNLALLDQKVRDSIFKSPNGPVATKIKDSPPTKYGCDATVSNSLISSGADIEGTVKNSVIFRGVHIARDTEVDHCVIMQNSIISEGSSLNYAVLDKNVSVRSGCRLSGYITHPFIAERNERI
ncbi:MAG: glucose-1-phosphate adenylyltransferase subunit GlgD [Anaerovoracaceae bacterium]|jgi:glucose-1-phosphate adenylyltransferase